MSIFNNKLIKNIFIFTLSTILNKGLNFFILPVLTYHLTKDDYGHLGFITSVVTITSIYVGLWPGNFLMAKFSKYGKEKIARYMSNIFVITGISFLVVYSILLLSKGVIFTKFDHEVELITLIMFYTLFTVFFNILNLITQLEKNALKFAYMQSFYSVSSLGIALLLIVKLHYGWEGKFFAELFILTLLAIYMFYYFKKEGYVKLDISIQKLKELFNYLFPMTFYVVGIYLLVTIDKILLAKYTDIASVGIYTIAMTMSIMVNIVYDSVINAWEPYFFEKIHTNNQKDINWIVISVILYSLFIVLSTVVYILIVPYLFDFMIDKKFSNSLEYIPYLVVAFGLEGLRKPLSSFLMHNSKVKTLASVSIFSAFLNIVLNIVLIQKFGILGAVYATVAAFFVLYILTLVFALKYCKIRYRSL